MSIITIGYVGWIVFVLLFIVHNYTYVGPLFAQQQQQQQQEQRKLWQVRSKKL
jgi:hypothetical protein